MTIATTPHPRSGAASSHLDQRGATPRRSMYAVVRVLGVSPGRAGTLSVATRARAELVQPRRESASHRPSTPQGV
jgi:hypothetical protein